MSGNAATTVDSSVGVMTINTAFDSAMATIRSQLATKRNQIAAADPNATTANEIAGKLSLLTSNYLTGVAKLSVSD